MKIEGFRGELYFHVLGPDRKLAYDPVPRRTVEPGREYKARKPWKYSSPQCWHAYKNRRPTHCVWGMHATRTGLYKAPGKGDWVCLVRLFGRVKHSYPSKTVALRRKVVAMRQVTSDAQGYELYYDSYYSRVVNWILKKPYKGIVA